MFIERRQDGFGKGVSDDGDDIDAFAVDGVEQLPRIEPSIRQGDDGASDVQATNGGERSGAMHQRAGGHDPGTGTDDCLGDTFKAALLGYTEQDSSVDACEEVVLTPPD